MTMLIETETSPSFTTARVAQPPDVDRENHDRYAHYEVCVLDDASNRYKGFGLTLDSVIAEESAEYARRVEFWNQAGGRPMADFLADEPDRVVWHGFRVVCILRPTAEGVFGVAFRAPGYEAGRAVEDRENDDSPAVLSRIERDYAALVEITAEVVRLADEEDRLREATEETERALIEAEDRLGVARLALTRSILEAAPRELPRLNLWHRFMGPYCTVRSGNRIFTLVPTRDADIPDDVEDVHEALTLAIIDVERGDYPAPAEVQSATIVEVDATRDLDLVEA
jgi:hypothetical protein